MNRNKTISLTDDEKIEYGKYILPGNLYNGEINVTINGNCFDMIPKLSNNSVDMLFLDPPYNLNKIFHNERFSKLSIDEYAKWLNDILNICLPKLKNTSTIYICGDWYSSISIIESIKDKFFIRNRITWERDKGRGSKTNYKNNIEDIWYCTMDSKNYTFNVDKIKSRKKVIAPYKDEDGNNKDWTLTDDGKFRETYPSNVWTDITIPFWSMSENTEHPTQKSEKLLAKLILASTNENDIILDPFLGSGTTSVVAKKLNRQYIGIEQQIDYAIVTEYRLNNLTQDIQGYRDGLFLTRNFQ